MRRVEVVSVVEHLELKIGEDAGEPGCDGAELVGFLDSSRRSVNARVTYLSK